jgi:arabinose-5-phosphate isomerase
MNLNRDAALATAQRVLQHEALALAGLPARLDNAFCDACELLLGCRGRVVVSGMGKSGHIAHKLAASLASTGTPAYFLHPAEAFHGDLGIVQPGDILLALSHSGETQELIELLTVLRAKDVPVIAITASASSSLARQADVALLLGDVVEADSHGLVPTTSTTLSLALGDALTVAVLEARGFTADGFALLHPKGMLGKQLNLRVRDLLRGEETNPVVGLDASFIEGLRVVSRYALGATSVVDEHGHLQGILTDGDIRRTIERHAEQGQTVHELMETRLSKLVTSGAFTSIHRDALAVDALTQMEQHQPRPIFVLPVYEYAEDGASKLPVGMLHLHALVQAGFKASHVLED